MEVSPWHSVDLHCNYFGAGADSARESPLVALAGTGCGSEEGIGAVE